MITKQQLQTKIQELEHQLTEFKYQLSNYKEITIENAKVGDVLEDGSIVVHKTDNMALLAAPASTEVMCQWSKEFSEIFDKLKQEGFTPSQWFIPTEEQLKLAYKNCKQHFASCGFYWSSTEVSSATACDLAFCNGTVGSCHKSSSNCVRAFRCVSF